MYGEDIEEEVKASTEAPKSAVPLPKTKLPDVSTELNTEVVISRARYCKIHISYNSISY